MSVIENSELKKSIRTFVYGENLFDTTKEFALKLLKKLKDNFSYIVAPLIVLLILRKLFEAFDVYPFGSNSQAYYDLLAQIAPYYEHLYDALIGGTESLFFTFDIAGGADLFATLCYFALSPIQFLFFVLGEGNAIYATTYVLYAKYIAISLVGAFFIKKTFKNLNEGMVTALSILYAFCGYSVVASTFINWLDFLIYVPLTLLAFRYLLRTGKMRWFALCVSAFIICCYALGSFSLIILFIITTLYVALCVEKDKQKHIMTKMVLGYVVGVLISACVLVPSIKAFVTSTRSNTDFFKALEVKAWNNYERKLSYVMLDVVFFVGALAQVVVSNKKDKKNVFDLLVFILLMIPVLVEESMLFLNGGSYMSYALRFGFLTAFWNMYLTCKFLSNSKKNIKGKISSRNLIISSLILFEVLYLAVTHLIDEYPKINGNWHSEFAHSLGTINVIATCFLLFWIAVEVALILFRCKKINALLLTVFLFCVAGPQVIFSTTQQVWGNNFNPINFTTLDELLDMAEEQGYYEKNSYTRVKDVNGMFSANFQLINDVASYSFFSSSMDKKNFEGPVKLGYENNGLNSLRSMNSNVFCDSVLSYKYYYLSNNWNYAGSKFCTLVGSKNGKYLYKNNFAFPYAFTVDNGNLNYGDDSFKGIQNLYKFLGGNGDFARTVTLEECTANVLGVEYYGETIKVNAYDMINRHIQFTFKGDYKFNGVVYMCAEYPSNANVHYRIGSGTSNKLFSSLDMGYRENISNVKIWLENYNVANGSQIEMKLYFKVLEMDKIEELYNIVSSKQASNFKINKDKITFDITSTKSGECAFLPFTAIDGYKIKVNGKEKKFIENDLNLMVVPLDEGENSVSIKYTNPSLALSGITAGISAILIGGIYLVLKKYNFIVERSEGVITKTAYVLAIGLTLFFFIYPLTNMLGNL